MQRPGRASIYRVLFETETQVGRAVDLSIQWLIVASLVASAVDTLPTISAQAHEALRWFEHASMVVFIVEYGLRVYSAPRPTEFARSFLGVVDLVAVLPFVLGLGFDMRAVRAFRLLRLVRMLKLLRYSRAMRRYRMAFGAIRAELTLYLLGSFVAVYVASVGIYQFEHEAQPDAFTSVFDAMWWAVATLTTVGYGDVVPVTAGGRAFTVLVLIVGLGVVAVPTALVASSLTEVLREEHED
ncbi:voltage-gated potassium channel [Rubrivirga sp. SAORIC476]|uniref:ion transporter n=1 Tax=Rubrivirga sp. SAORIC476 TaxID=1961794 RepID=UPI000BA98ACE|nr:ion transporter [Rubrivirga sp. SAORIC476]PAP79636.1 voltage-gated potassium channel [Rubrivirga sp. SAORIC476]